MTARGMLQRAVGTLTKRQSSILLGASFRMSVKGMRTACTEITLWPQLLQRQIRDARLEASHTVPHFAPLDVSRLGEDYQMQSFKAPASTARGRPLDATEPLGTAAPGP